jgi:hypothetical protein
VCVCVRACACGNLLVLMGLICHACHHLYRSWPFLLPLTFPGFDARSPLRWSSQRDNIYVTAHRSAAPVRKRQDRSPTSIGSARQTESARVRPATTPMAAPPNPMLVLEEPPESTAQGLDSRRFAKLVNRSDPSSIGALMGKGCTQSVQPSAETNPTSHPSNPDQPPSQKPQSDPGNEGEASLSPGKPRLARARKRTWGRPTHSLGPYLSPRRVVNTSGRPPKLGGRTDFAAFMRQMGMSYAEALPHPEEWGATQLGSTFKIGGLSGGGAHSAPDSGRRVGTLDCRSAASPRTSPERALGMGVGLGGSPMGCEMARGGAKGERVPRLGLVRGRFGGAEIGAVAPLGFPLEIMSSRTAKPPAMSGPLMGRQLSTAR